MRSLIVPIALLTLAACGEPSHTFDQPAIVECTYEDVPVAWADEAPNGLVPNDLLDFAEGTHTSTGGFQADDAAMPVTVELARRGEHAVYRENTEGGCGSFLSIPVTLGFATEDGSFDELVQADASEAFLETDALKVSAGLDPSDLGGTYTPEPAAGQVRGLELEVLFQPTTLGGDVFLLTEGVDGDTAWADREEVFHFGAGGQ